MIKVAKKYWTPLAWIDGAWRQRVLLEIDSQGCWLSVTTDLEAPPSAEKINAPVLPGLTNAHSHAFQRAFAGMSERRHAADDNFWSWRDRMYKVANRVNAVQLQAIAIQLYTELLEGGYTQVCEFHYLQHALVQNHDDKFAMTWALTQAAAQAGIGLTILPVLYERAGFKASCLSDDQKRFATDVEFILQLKQEVDAAKLANVHSGVAIHSLRAAHATSITNLTDAMQSRSGPIHIHIAEQQAEVQECLEATGMRPIEWLCAQGYVDKRWHLVHATHATEQEISTVAKTGAQVVICPTTEANLGDGLTDVPSWLTAGVGMSIGSDSHVSRTWREELRWLEYGQRLRLQQRNILAAPSNDIPATAQRLFNTALLSGGLAAGHSSTGICVGARADMVVLERKSNGLIGMPDTHLLDALIFANDTAAIDYVYVAGNLVVKNGKHVSRSVVADKFTQTMHELWQ
jgi:formimidoylglutamate deiminase